MYVKTPRCLQPKLVYMYTYLQVSIIVSVFMLGYANAVGTIDTRHYTCTLYTPFMYSVHNVYFSASFPSCLMHQHTLSGTVEPQAFMGHEKVSRDSDSCSVHQCVLISGGSKLTVPL